MAKRRHVMTPARRAALKRATEASARKRRHVVHHGSEIRSHAVAIRSHGKAAVPHARALATHGKAIHGHASAIGHHSRAIAGRKIKR